MLNGVPQELSNATHAELQAKITKLRQKMKYLQEIKAQFQARPDGHLSLTDPDARAMTHPQHEGNGDGCQYKALH